MNYQNLIDQYYPVGTLRRDIYMRHCSSVANEAIEIARRNHLPLPESDIIAAAMLHDIGIFLTNAPAIGCHGTEPYIRHGILGAELLREKQFPEKFARVAELHTGSGLTAHEIEQQQLPLPKRDLVPNSLLEKLICYADKFYSKGGEMKRKPIERVMRDMERFGCESAKRFTQLHMLFTPHPEIPE